LTSVDIPNFVTTIGNYAFYECDNLERIYCKPTTPVECDPNFTAKVLNYATLYVPIMTKAAYQQVAPWKNFHNIKEMDFSSGIDDVETDEEEPMIKVDGGVLTVSAGADSSLPVEVYDTCGKMVYRGHGSRIEGLHPGIYIVRVDDTVKKIII